MLNYNELKSELNSAAVITSTRLSPSVIAKGTELENVDTSKIHCRKLNKLIDELSSSGKPEDLYELKQLKQLIVDLAKIHIQETSNSKEESYLFSQSRINAVKEKNIIAEEFRLMKDNLLLTSLFSKASTEIYEDLIKKVELFRDESIDQNEFIFKTTNFLSELNEAHVLDSNSFSLLNEFFKNSSKRMQKDEYLLSPSELISFKLKKLYCSALEIDINNQDREDVITLAQIHFSIYLIIFNAKDESDFIAQSIMYLQERDIIKAFKPEDYKLLLLYYKTQKK